MGKYAQIGYKESVLGGAVFGALFLPLIGLTGLLDPIKLIVLIVLLVFLKFPAPINWMYIYLSVSVVGCIGSVWENLTIRRVQGDWYDPKGLTAEADAVRKKVITCCAYTWIIGVAISSFFN
ncbi:MAG: hypothetical protein HQK88_05185 [Nitrospirae bacterium]|nr:hypothetical protein [Nitrospirota bacterium]MBF0534039.1 hypothetical protein [Nitrospirota bacterium]MBF0616198.1 hypothetical protein [Nitrospirota bacterium]